MQDTEFDFNLLIAAMGELAMRSLATLVPVFFALFASGLAVDYYFAEYSFAGLFAGVLQFVISYFLVKGLARHSGLLSEGDAAPGFTRGATPTRSFLSSAFRCSRPSVSCSVSSRSSSPGCS